MSKASNSPSVVRAQAMPEGCLVLPAVVVAVPLFLMFRQLGLHDTHLGMIILYTVFNLSLTVWLLKGFIDEIPREYEEAALIDGYTRFQAFRKVVLPQAATGIASTAIFCLIFAWNEYAFAVLLTSGEAQTAPPFIPIIIGEGGMDWPAVAAGTTSNASTSSTPTTRTSNASLVLLTVF